MVWKTSGKLLLLALCLSACQRDGPKLPPLEQGADYRAVLERAAALVDEMRQSPITELRSEFPQLSSSGEIDDGLREACSDLGTLESGTGSLEGITSRAGVVVYARMEHEDPAGVNYLGITPDMRCGLLTLSREYEPAANIKMAGDRNVLAVLFAKHAIEVSVGMGVTRTVTNEERRRAAFLLSTYGKLTGPSADQSGHQINSGSWDEAVPPARWNEPADLLASGSADWIGATDTRFHLTCSGPDALLPVPFEARYSINMDAREWALCVEDQCNDKQPIISVSSGVLLLENEDGFRTTYFRNRQVLMTTIAGPGGPAILRELQCTVSPSVPLSGF